MNKATDAASALRQWNDGTRIWLVATCLCWLLASVGGVILIGLAALLTQLMLWVPIGSGMSRLRAAHNYPAEQADAKPLLILLFSCQVVSLLYLAWLWLNLINIDLNTH